MQCWHKWSKLYVGTSTRRRTGSFQGKVSSGHWFHCSHHSIHNWNPLGWYRMTGLKLLHISIIVIIVVSLTKTNEWYYLVVQLNICSLSRCLHIWQRSQQGNYYCTLIHQSSLHHQGSCCHRNTAPGPARHRRGIPAVCNTFGTWNGSYSFKCQSLGELWLTLGENWYFPGC